MQEGLSSSDRTCDWAHDWLSVLVYLLRERVGDGGKGGEHGKVDAQERLCNAICLSCLVQAF